MSRSAMPKRSWIAGRGTLAIVAMLLFMSGAIRFGVGHGAALADEMDLPNLLSDLTTEKQPDGEDISPELVALLTQTKAREEAVLRREAELEARIQALALVEEAVSRDIDRLKEAEETLRSTIAVADGAAESDITALTAVYENMKPEQAAPLFQRMEASFAAGFLGRMRPDASAAILANLDPDLGYAISVVLAGRNADVNAATSTEFVSQ